MFRLPKDLSTKGAKKKKGEVAHRGSVSDILAAPAKKSPYVRDTDLQLLAYCRGRWTP
jgi:hypothetical protein